MYDPKNLLLEKSKGGREFLMDYVKVPNLPEGRVRLAVADGRISRGMERNMKESGIGVVKTGKHSRVYDAISWHPDILLHHVGGRDIVYAPDTGAGLLEELSRWDFNLLQGETVLTDKYPGDIAYNVARIGGFAFHNFKYTDPVLKKMLEIRQVELVHVNQGYSKCSVSVVDSQSLITSDRGIARAAEKKGLNVLLIAEADNIFLPGVGQGFIGGSSGLTAKNTWAVTGDFHSLKAACEIGHFLAQRGIKAVSLSPDPVLDMGSIIPLLTDRT